MWMSSQWKMLVVSLCAQLVGCKDDPSQMGDETSTGPGPTSETDDPTTMTANPETTLPDPDSGESSIGPVTETVTDTESTTTNDTQTATESESETAGGLGCVNEVVAGTGVYLAFQSDALFQSTDGLRWTRTVIRPS